MGKNIGNKNTLQALTEEQERLKNEIKSNLRYVWQKTISYALIYKPTIKEFTEELEREFLLYLKNNHRQKKQVQQILRTVVRKLAPEMAKSKNISSRKHEEQFIEKTISKLQGILF